MQLVTSRTTTPPPEPLEPWVDIKTVCSHIHFGRSLVARMAKDGKIPAARIKNGAKVYWRFQLSQVDAALKGQGSNQ